MMNLVYHIIEKFMKLCLYDELCTEDLLSAHLNSVDIQQYSSSVDIQQDSMPRLSINIRSYLI